MSSPVKSVTARMKGPGLRAAFTVAPAQAGVGASAAFRV